MEDSLYIFKDPIVVKHLSGLRSDGHDKRYHLNKLRKRVKFLDCSWEDFLSEL